MSNSQNDWHLQIGSAIRESLRPRSSGFLQIKTSEDTPPDNDNFVKSLPVQPVENPVFDNFESLRKAQKFGTDRSGLLALDDVCQDILQKAQPFNYVNLGIQNLEKSGEGSRGGKIIGHTKSGKPIYENHKNTYHRDFYTPDDHRDAMEHHERESKAHEKYADTRSSEPRIKNAHLKAAEQHNEARKHHGKMSQQKSLDEYHGRETPWKKSQGENDLLKARDEEQLWSRRGPISSIKSSKKFMDSALAILKQFNRKFAKYGAGDTGSDEPLVDHASKAIKRGIAGKPYKPVKPDDIELLFGGSEDIEEIESALDSEELSSSERERFERKLNKLYDQEDQAAKDMQPFFKQLHRLGQKIARHPHKDVIARVVTDPENLYAIHDGYTSLSHGEIEDVLPDHVMSRLEREASQPKGRVKGYYRTVKGRRVFVREHPLKPRLHKSKSADDLEKAPHSPEARESRLKRDQHLDAYKGNIKYFRKYIKERMGLKKSLDELDALVKGRVRGYYRTVKGKRVFVREHPKGSKISRIDDVAEANAIIDDALRRQHESDSWKLAESVDEVWMKPAKSPLTKSIRTRERVILEEAGLLEKSTDELSKGNPFVAGQGEGSRGGHVIGRTKSGKPIYSRYSHHSHSKFSPDEHKDAAKLHKQLGNAHLKKYESGKGDESDFDKAKLHLKRALRHMRHAA